MIDLASMLSDPTNVSEVTKIMAKYQLMQSLGNAVEGKLTGENRRKDLETEMLELSIAEKRRALGYLDEEKYESDKPGYAGAAGLWGVSQVNQINRQMDAQRATEVAATNSLKRENDRAYNRDREMNRKIQARSLAAFGKNGPEYRVAEQDWDIFSPEYEGVKYGENKANMLAPYTVEFPKTKVLKFGGSLNKLSKTLPGTTIFNPYADAGSTLLQNITPEEVSHGKPILDLIKRLGSKFIR
jgi:hypothetical protein